MAIKVSATQDQTLEELQSKLGSLGLEFVFDEDDQKELEPKKDDNNEKKDTSKDN